MSKEDLEDYFKCISKDCIDGPVLAQGRQGKSLAVLFPSLVGVVDPWSEAARDLMEAAAEVPMAAAAAKIRSQAHSSGSRMERVDLEPDAEVCTTEGSVLLQ